MNGWRYALASFVHYWRMNLALMLGVAVGTAVLTGALLVGDSVKQSLSDLAIERLGKIDYILMSEPYFSNSLMDKVNGSQALHQHFTEALPAILIPHASIEFESDEFIQRASQINVIGCHQDFWEQDATIDHPDLQIENREIILNRSLANTLGVVIGDEVIVRIGKVSGIAKESPLADKSDIGQSLVELRVAHIVETKGLGRFSLNSSQHLPLNVYVSLELLQDALEQEEKYNAILFVSPRINVPPPADALESLHRCIRPTVEDAGMSLTRVTASYVDEAKSSDTSDTDPLAFTYLQLTTDRMVIPDSALDILTQQLESFPVTPVFTYLANTIYRVGNEQPGIPYSTIAAVDFTDRSWLPEDSLPPDFQLRDDQILLNSWAAKDQKAKIGDEIEVTFFAPETTHGNTVERKETFQLTRIEPLTKPLLPYGEERRRERPARYVERQNWVNDPDFTPTVKGITDKNSIANWDAPFPFDYDRITERKPRDDDYWDFYRTTPKAFISYKTGKRIWGSRFGHATSLRLHSDAKDDDRVREMIELGIQKDLDAFGFRLLDVKNSGILAAKGTTPFNVLFLGFSFFIMAAAIMLVAILFRLSIEQRATENGLLLALGIDRQRVGKLNLQEAGLIGLVGAILGAGFGTVYAWLMIFGLKTRWLDAVVTPFLKLTITWQSLLVGGMLGVITTVGTISWTLFRMRKISLRSLLAGNVEETVASRTSRSTYSFILSIVMFAFAAITGVSGVFLSGESQAGAFFGCGACVLIGLLTLVWRYLRSDVQDNRFDSRVQFREWDLVLRNAARNSGRSVLTIGLVASACFLIIAISAFRLSPTAEGTAGFEMVATSELPIFLDLNREDVRDDIFGSAKDQLAKTKFVAFRFQAGEDASCRNLYQTQRPRLLGIGKDAIAYFDDADVLKFQWAGSAAESADEKRNPWNLLKQKTTDGPIPVVLDKNTAMYSLHLYGGVGTKFELDYGSDLKIEFQIAGLLSNSILQGSLIVNEEDLVERFESVSGRRFFLIDTPEDQAAEVTGLLEATLDAEGFDAVNAEEMLTDLLAVQNTYLSTFQSLGGLGLLLGTFGLMAVQLRNVWQRRSEIALLKATGFAQSKIGRLILWEHALLLFGGLGIGILAALLTVLPHIVFGGASIPFFATIQLLLLILVVGLATGFLAVQSSRKLPLLVALRGS